MLPEAAFYGELLLFLVGTFLYGFLVRELFRQRAILPGNRAMRALALCLALWYAGSLLDELLAILLPGAVPIVGPAIDVVRSAGWLASFPLLAHAIWSLVDRRRSAVWLVPGYLSLLLFVPTVISVLSRGETRLAGVSRDVYPAFVVHASLSVGVAIALVRAALIKVRGNELARFLRWLFWMLLLVEALVLAGATGVAVWDVPLWRLLVEASGLVLGVSFLYFVRRYNLMRLSLENRSLRHFAGIFGLVLLVLLAASAADAEPEDGRFRRLFAWSLVFAVASGLCYRPGLAWAVSRSPRLARWLSKSISEKELDALTDRLKTLDLAEDEKIELTRREVGRLLGADVDFVRAPDARTQKFWTHFETDTARPFNRLRAPSPELEGALAENELHAVFPLRVERRLAGLFTIGASAAGGGYEDGEMEGVSLVIRQLVSSLEIQRLVEARLDAERREAERERLSMLGMVTASLAHELKNPLASMKALAQTVCEELSRTDATSEQARDLGIIVEQVDRLDAVAREILGFTRPHRGGGTELQALVASACYILAPEARRRGIALDRNAVEPVGEVPGSPASWQTIVFNLMVNAIRHAPGGSMVTVRLRREQNGLVFECENQGPAIPDELAARLFDPFVSETSAADGTGLGLALVRRRASELGGSVELVNEPDRIVFRVRG